MRVIKCNIKYRIGIQTLRPVCTLLQWTHVEHKNILLLKCTSQTKSDRPGFFKDV